MSQKTMHITEVIEQIRAAEKPFLLKFYRATGAKKGTIKTVAKARSGFPNDFNKKREGDPKVRFKDSGLIPITDVESQSYLTPYRALICQFKNFKVKH